MVESECFIQSSKTEEVKVARVENVRVYTANGVSKVLTVDLVFTKMQNVAREARIITAILCPIVIYSKPAQKVTYALAIRDQFGVESGAEKSQM